MNRNLHSICVLIGTAMLTLAVGAQSPAIVTVPPVINYQGAILDASGNKIADGNTNVVFRVYDSVFNGQLLWGPRTNSVALVGSVFNTLLGGADAQNRDFAQVLSAQALNPNAPAFLELTVGDSTIQPRQQILATPFAFVANTAGTAINAGYATNSGSAAHANVAALADHAMLADSAGVANTSKLSDYSKDGDHARSANVLVDSGNNLVPLIVGAEPNLRIIRGSVAADGTILAGRGFTVKASTGQFALYQIVYDVPFTGPLVMVASPDETGGNVVVQIDNAAGHSESSFVEFHPASRKDLYIQAPFNFIVIGPK